MNLESHPNLGAGMNRDVQRHLLDGQFYDALDVIIDIDGKTRKRGGTTAMLPVATNVYPQWLGAYHSGGQDDVRMLYGAGTYYWNVGGAVLPQIAWAMNGTPRLGGAMPAEGYIGRPFRFGRYVCFPVHYGLALYRQLLVFAGTRAGKFTAWEANALTAAGTAITLGSNQVTIAAADRINVQIGDWLACSAGGAFFNSPVSYADETTTRVFTDHVSNFTTAGINALLDYTGPVGNGLVIGAKAATSFQNRIIYGDLATSNLAGSEYRLQPNALAWSALPTETVVFGATYHGFHQHAVPLGNILLVPDVSRIVGLAPVGPSQLLILSPERTLRLAGNFATISADNQQLPIDLQPISTRVGCISDRSIQESSYGALWAAADGVWLYDGAQLTNTMDGRLLSYWRGLVAQGSPAFQICGSAMVRGDHYIISTTLGNLMLNLRLGAWTRLRDDWRIGGSTVDAADPTRTYASYWLDPAAGAAPAASKNHIFRLDTILDPTPTNAVDHDGQIVTCSLESQAYVQGDPARLKRIRRVAATADVKAPLNLLPPDAYMPAPVRLPNMDTDDVPSTSKRWWRSSSCALTPVTTPVLGGAYSMRGITSLANGNTLYDVGGGLGDNAVIEAVEAWVRSDTAGTVTLDYAGATDTFTIPLNTFNRMALRLTPAAGALLARRISIIHSANPGTFYVGRMDLRYLGAWRDANTTSLVNGATLTFTYAEGTPIGCLHCVCPATASTGIAYLVPFPLLAGQTYRATITAKHQTGATDYILYLGEGATAATRNEAPVALTPGVWKTFSVLLQPTTTLLAPVISLRRASPNSGTFRAYGASLTGPPATLDVAIIGGLEAEGDYGDGVATNQAGWPSSTDYARDYELVGDAGLFAWTLSGTDLRPVNIGEATAQLYMRGARLCSDGEATVSYTPGTSSDIANVFLDARPAGTRTDRLLANINGGSGLLEITKRVNNFTTNMASTAVAALVVGVRYWLKIIRRGTNLRIEHWNVEPSPRGTPLNSIEIELDATAQADFAEPGYFGFGATPQTDMAINGFACEPYDSVGRFVPDVSAPGGLSEAGAVLTRAATLRYRSRNAAAEVELGGIDLEYSYLRAGRPT